MPTADRSTTREKIRAHRARLRKAGLRPVQVWVPCRMMVDKLTAVPRNRLGELVGSLAAEEVKALNRAIFVFLGVAETETSQE